MKNLCLLFVPLLWSLNLSGQVITLDARTSPTLNISDRMVQFVDTAAALSLTQAAQQSFRPVGQTNFRVPFWDAASWYRCTLRNETTAPKTWYIEWSVPVAELVECYLVAPDGTVETQRGGTLVEKSARAYAGEFPYFKLDLLPARDYQVYFRVTSQRGHRVDVNLYDSSALYANEIDNAAVTGFASGLVVLRLFFVLLLAIFVVRERAFRAYSFMLVLRSLGYWGIMSKLGAGFTDDPALATVINFLSYHSVPIGYVLVVRALLPSERLPAFVHHVLNVIVAAVVLLGAAIVLDYRWYWLLASEYLGLFSQVFVFGLYLYALARKIPINWYYSVPFLLGVGSYFLLVASLVGILNAEWVFSLAYLLFVSEIFVFGVFLGKIILDYRRQRESARRETMLKEEQAAYLKELDGLKTNFFANISHELRTPLTMLVGPLEDFRQQQPANPLIPAMQRNVRRLRSLIDQLLDLSRLEAGHLRPTIVRADLPVFLRQLFASFESLAQSRHIIFNHQQNRTHFEACFDPDKLEKIVTNLLSNAFKFTPESGRVMVQVDYTDTELNLEVRDYGVGIEAARLPHIFDRFYRVESEGKHHTEGAGIGLSLVHELVKVLKGKIGVESEPGRGSVFTLRLPTDGDTWANFLTDDAPVPSPAAIQPGAETDMREDGSEPVGSESADSEAPLLLLVEDNPDLRAYMRSIFQEHYRIVEARDGQEGLDCAFEEIPDLALCDVMMPRLDGFGFCEKIKTDPRTSHIPVIMLTAKATLDDRLAGLELGADDYLTKPFARAELLLRVQNLLKQRALLRQKYGQQIAEATAIGRETPARTLDEKFLKTAIQTVREQGGDSQFGIDDLCAALNVSRSNLHRKLKALTDQSTTQFIRSIRLYRAAELLKQKGVTVAEVAYEVGFDSPSYFSKSFSDQMGVTPSDWALSDND